ncbi:hypothetical protein OG887_00975 [Streptomyces sp. NBC_00053]|nr:MULTISPECIES: hypothetical protein [unclassified Streptomyces]MCX5498029.1 hypothetical protein [Streptomyces sp. NBC_00052]MCX5553439.1 hypothetical protein [Streptomyces sp. NBC_00051]WSP51648.1 hypothetical protein OG348_40910 [Streptomyces sp. NBC_01243]
MADHTDRTPHVPGPRHESPDANHDQALTSAQPAPGKRQGLGTARRR